MNATGCIHFVFRLGSIHLSKHFLKIKEAPLSSTDSDASFSQRGWEKCSRSNKGVYVCFVIYFT